jgi:hypothetical protein
MEAEMKLFYVDTDYGCGIRAAKNIAQAKKEALIENGTRNLKSVRPATKEDVSSVKAMGGWVPEGKVQ